MDYMPDILFLHCRFVLDMHGHSRKQGVFLFGCIPEKRQLRPASPFIKEDVELAIQISNHNSFKREDSKYTAPGLGKRLLA